MTVEHPRPLLDSPRDHRLLRTFVQNAQGVVPESIVDAVRLGRMTALRKFDGGVRGIVFRDVIRQLVSRTISQQMSATVESATALFSAPCQPAQGVNALRTFCKE